MEIEPALGQIHGRTGPEDQPSIKGMDQLLRTLLQISPVPCLSASEQYSCPVGNPEIQEIEGALSAGGSLVAEHRAQATEAICPLAALSG